MVVVAHSYSGVPVTQATPGATNVAHLVYTAAYVPEAGEAMFPIHGVPAPQTLAGTRPVENPDLNLPAAFFDSDLDNPETAAVISRLVPQNVRADLDAANQAGWKTIPSSYVIPENNISTTGTVAEQMAARTGRTYRTPGNHAPFHSHPKEFAALLATIVRDADAGR